VGLLPRADALASAIMSHKHENLLNAIFHDPINSNIPWREVESLLHHLGATVESLSGTRIHIKLNGHEGTLHRPHHGSTLGREDVKHVREFLAHSRVTPSLYAAANAPASPPTRQK
jgi:hypothetical protein